MFNTSSPKIHKQIRELFTNRWGCGCFALLTFQQIIEAAENAALPESGTPQKIIQVETEEGEEDATNEGINMRQSLSRNQIVNNRSVFEYHFHLTTVKNEVSFNKLQAFSF